MVFLWIWRTLPAHVLIKKRAQHSQLQLISNFLKKGVPIQSKFERPLRLVIHLNYYNLFLIYLISSSIIINHNSIFIYFVYFSLCSYSNLLEFQCSLMHASLPTQCSRASNCICI